MGGASRLVRLWALGCLVLMASWPVAARAAVSFQVTLRDTGIADQDDMCIWLHPSDLSRSTVICSDKTAYKLFVYDLSTLATFYRILSFAVLGFLLLCVSWTYTRFQSQLRRYF